MHIGRPLALSILLALLAAFPGSRAAAEPLAPPAGPVILEVGGLIAAANDAALARFDLAMLDALPQRDTVTATPWHEGTQTFSGPLIGDLLDSVGAGGSALRVVAINDYSVDIPVQDVRDHPVILASRRNGATMPLREKGPLFVIYPFDEDPRLFNELYFSRSVWQVKAIEILP